MGDVTQNRNWQAPAVAVLSVLAAAGLAAYTAAASYESVSALAAAHHLPLARLYPLSTDGGLFAVIGLDVALTWLGRPLGWLRLAARLFAAGTLAANFAAGWPDVTGALLRVAAPLLFVILAETARTLLLRGHRAAAGDGRIPLWRWVLAPRSTFRLWRRMKLWRIGDYGQAVDMELSRLAAIECLCERYRTRAWQDKVPADVAWMLTAGVRMEQALERVAELCAPQAPAAVAAASATRGRPASARRKRPAGGRSIGIDKQAQALALYHANPDITGGQMGRELGLSASRGRAILAQLKREAPDTGPLETVRD